MRRLDEAIALLDAWCAPLPGSVCFEATHVSGVGPSLTLEIEGMTTFPNTLLQAETVFRGLRLFREMAPLAPVPGGHHDKRGRRYGWVGKALAYSDLARQHTVFVDDIETAARCVQFDSIVHYALETGRLPGDPSKHAARSMTMIDLSDAGAAVAGAFDAPLAALRRRLAETSDGEAA